MPGGDYKGVWIKECCNLLSVKYDSDIVWLRATLVGPYREGSVEYRIDLESYLRSLLYIYNQSTVR